jgi:hypothetical protein
LPTGFRRAMGKGGEIFIFDMWRAQKIIIDPLKKWSSLADSKPDKEIEIKNYRALDPARNYMRNCLTMSKTLPNA